MRHTSSITRAICITFACWSSALAKLEPGLSALHLIRRTQRAGDRASIRSHPCYSSGPNGSTCSPTGCSRRILIANAHSKATESALATVNKIRGGGGDDARRVDDRAVDAGARKKTLSHSSNLIRSCGSFVLYLFIGTALANMKEGIYILLTVECWALIKLVKATSEVSNAINRLADASAFSQPSVAAGFGRGSSKCPQQSSKFDCHECNEQNTRW